MRMSLALVLCLLAVPAVAEEWDSYANDRFGYRIPVPPGFVGEGESDNSDGQTFTGVAQNGTLTVWASHGSGNFAMDALAEGNGLGQDAWHVTTQVIRPIEARFSAIKGIRVLREAMMLLCDGNAIAIFRLDYPVTASADMEPVFKRLVRGFDRGGC